MRSFFALGALALAAVASAQEQYHIDPETVDDATKAKWCLDQREACPLICTQQPNVTSTTTLENECDEETLVYSCVCENEMSPNLTEYSQTIPYWICTEWQNQCVKDCGLANNACANSCRADHPCGATVARPGNASATASQSNAAQTGSSETSPAANWGGPATTNGPGGEGAASAMLNLGQSYGMAVVFAGVFAGFALIL